MFSYEHPRPAVTTDIALLHLCHETLQVLLIKRAHEPHLGKWALPGGFVDIDEDLDAAARRELAEETGVTGVALQQLHTFGALGRDPRGRVITVVYYGVVTEQPSLDAATDAAAARWFALEAIPDLAFDHAEILQMARARVTAELDL